MPMPAHSTAVGTEPIFPWRSLNARAWYMRMIGSPSRTLMARTIAETPTHKTINAKALVRNEVLLVRSMIAILSQPCMCVLHAGKRSSL